MTDDSHSPAEQLLSGLQDIEDHLSTLARTANAILPDLERQLSGSRRQAATEGELVRAREALTSIARAAEHLMSVVDDLNLPPPGPSSLHDDERLVARLDRLANRARPSAPDLGL